MLFVRAHMSGNEYSNLGSCDIIWMYIYTPCEEIARIIRSALIKYVHQIHANHEQQFSLTVPECYVRNTRYGPAEKCPNTSFRSNCHQLFASIRPLILNKAISSRMLCAMFNSVHSNLVGMKQKKKLIMYLIDLLLQCPIVWILAFFFRITNTCGQFPWSYVFLSAFSAEVTPGNNISSKLLSRR